jgi:hypothetical protein
MKSLPNLASLRLGGRNIRIRESSTRGKFAQAAQILNYSSTEITEQKIGIGELAAKNAKKNLKRRGGFETRPLGFGAPKNLREPRKLQQYEEHEVRTPKERGHSCPRILAG